MKPYKNTLNLLDRASFVLDLLDSDKFMWVHHPSIFPLNLLSGCMCTLGISVIPEMGIALDRLSTLPDNLLCLILSKLPFREVVQCFILSKRWRFLYREMPNLDLSPYFLTPQYLQPPTPDPLSMETLENIISNILQSHSSDLTVVRLTNDTCRVESHCHKFNVVAVYHPKRIELVGVPFQEECRSAHSQRLPAKGKPDPRGPFLLHSSHYAPTRQLYSHPYSNPIHWI
jgi:hypothetical protein